MVPWVQKISQQAFKVEDKILPLLAQHWARISRTVQRNSKTHFRIIKIYLMKIFIYYSPSYRTRKRLVHRILLQFSIPRFQ